MGIQGIGVCAGKKTAVLYDTRTKESYFDAVAGQDIDKEQAILKAALTSLDQCYEGLCQKAVSIAGKAAALLIKGHQCMAEDAVYQQEILNCIKTKSYPAEAAVMEITSKMTNRMLESEDSYLKARGIDLIQVSRMLLYHIQQQREPNRKKEETHQNHEEFIACGTDFSMEELLMLSNQGAIAFLDEAGDTESHTVMIARALEFPMILQCSSQLFEYIGSIVTIDGDSGTMVTE